MCYCYCFNCRLLIEEINSLYGMLLLYLCLVGFVNE